MGPGETMGLVAVMIGGSLIVSTIVKGVIQFARIKADSQSGGQQLAGEVSALRDEVAALRHELIETHERLDFTERLLTQGRAEPREVR
ncbi:MAG: hypothetical protein U0133_07660 [Gemmatimonadales bacterium]